MIARIWHGETTVAKADAYMEEYFLQTGLADYQGTDGNLGVLVLRKDEDGQADFLMLTLWESEDAIGSLRATTSTTPDTTWKIRSTSLNWNLTWFITMF